ncbi:MAG: flavodoxin family protein [Chloroflexia bacterium]|nr:flavodoxin family protein [Chloroflexia bacterium]
MNALVIYDSVFGNTETIAQAIAAALGTQAISVSQAEAGHLRGLDLLVVGSPTCGLRPTEGMVKLLQGLPKNHLTGVRVAAVDTRIALEWCPTT